MPYTRGHKINSENTSGNMTTMEQGGTDKFCFMSKITCIFSHLFSIQVIRKSKGKLQKRNRSRNERKFNAKLEAETNKITAQIEVQI